MAASPQPLLLLLLLLLLLCMTHDGCDAMPRWFTFYGDDAANQHAWSNLGTSSVAGISGELFLHGSSSAGVAQCRAATALPGRPHAPSPRSPTPPSSLCAPSAAWSQYGRYGLLHVSGWARYPSWPPHCHHNASYDCPVGGLTPTWQATVEQQLDAAMPLLQNGTIKGLFLGDEPCCMGVPVWALETVAAFCKKKTAGTGAFVYVNECGRPFDPRLAYNGSFRTSNGMRVPASLDVISIDMYCPSGSLSTDPGVPPAVPLAGVPRCAPSQDYKQAALEPIVARAFYEHYIYPLLSSHQRVGVVPGTYGNSSESVEDEDPWLVKKLEGYFNWSLSDPRLDIINPWHWTSQCINKSHGSFADRRRCVHKNDTADIQCAFVSSFARLGPHLRFSHLRACPPYSVTVLTVPGTTGEPSSSQSCSRRWRRSATR